MVDGHRCLLYLSCHEENYGGGAILGINLSLIEHPLLTQTNPQYYVQACHYNKHTSLRDMYTRHAGMTKWPHPWDMMVYVSTLEFEEVSNVQPAYVSSRKSLNHADSCASSFTEK